ncbi:hypothetical protein B9Z19DRAFT_1060808 [Tuber borchii]|uniref:VHS domain-containing protein n=1 Tax=Tuber borchii TaxID=42251 RepID=A0A2T7A7K2_TUBBO|nr:hypothetical protein B9Z19DRAFT_1060808 [Tuber borchii]
MKRILTTFKREKGDGLFYPSFVCRWRKRLEVLMGGGKNAASEKRYRDTGDRGRNGSSTSLPEDDSPEGRIVIATKSFCESGGPQSQNPGDEVLHLPAIVDLAESSPAAARAAAHTIRKYLEQKKNNSLRPHTQYNAIMLLRILSDNPGRTFTRNLGEAKFVAAVKELLKHGREPSVRQILVETLEHFDEKGLVEVWVKERKSMTKLSKSAPASNGGGGGVFSSGSNTNGQYQPHHYQTQQSHLPNMEELAARIAEAQTSAKLLEQVLQSTPHPEIPQSELIREFADRCKVASRSIQGYISAATGSGDGGGSGGDSGMDEDTLTTLIMTNDLLTMAVSKHALAVKEALEKQEVHKTVEGARIADVAGEDTSVVGSGGDGPVTPPKGAGMEVGVHRDAQRERERERVPDSPVSPTMPGPVAYRY